MPAPGELPPSLAGLAQRPPLGLGVASPELDVSRLVQVTGQSIGLYVETISDAPSTAAAEFDNFTAARIRG